MEIRSFSPLRAVSESDDRQLLLDMQFEIDGILEREVSGSFQVACLTAVDRYVFPMRLLATICALFTPLLMIGCATQENQPTAAETALEKYDQRGWNTEEGRVR
jgi:hypothetical protein